MITMGITLSIPTFLMAFAGSPRSSTNHSTFCCRKINRKAINFFLQTTPTDKVQKISRPDGAGFDDLEGLKKKKQRIRGDQD